MAPRDFVSFSTRPSGEESAASQQSFVGSLGNQHHQFTNAGQASAPAAGQNGLPHRQKEVDGNRFAMLQDLEDDEGIKNLFKKYARPDPAGAPEVTFDTVDIKELPLDVQYTENPKLYPTYLKSDVDKNYPLDKVYEYRGADVRSFGPASHLQGFAMLQFPEAGNRIVGWPQAGGLPADQMAKRNVKVKFRLNSQMPCISITILRGEGNEGGKKNISCDIFASGLWTSDKKDEVGLHSVTRGNEQDQDLSQPILQELAKKNRLWETRVRLAAVPHGPKAGIVGDPIWHGGEPGEVDSILDRARALQDLSEFESWPQDEQTIALLLHEKEITIWRTWSDEKPAASDKGKGKGKQTSDQVSRDVPKNITDLCQYMTSICYATAVLGDFWWFVNHTGGRSLSDRNFPFQNKKGQWIAFPRWLTETAVVTYKDGVAVHYEPDMIRAFDKLETDLYPSAKVVAFMTRFAEAREIQQQDRVLRALTDMAAGSIQCKLHKFGAQGHYQISIWFPKLLTSGPEKVDKEALSIELKRRVDISIRHTDGSGPGADVYFRGEVNEDAFETGCHCAVHATVRGDHAPSFDDENKIHLCSLEFVRDIISTNRCMNAVSELEDGHARKTGVFMQDIAFGAPIPGNVDRRWLLSDAERQAADVAFRQVFLAAGLNDTQTAGCLEPIYTEDGLKLFHGPPGTGKTKATTALVCAILKYAGRGSKKMLSTANSNSAVGNAVESFKEFNEKNQAITGITDTEWIHFKGVHAGFNPFSDEAKPFLGEDVEMTDFVPDEEAAPTADPMQEPLVNWSEHQEEHDEAEAAKEEAEAERQDKARRLLLFAYVMSNAESVDTSSSRYHYLPATLARWVKKVKAKNSSWERITKAQFAACNAFTTKLAELRELESQTAPGSYNRASNASRLSEKLEEFNEAAKEVTVHFFQQLKLVFCTNNSSCHAVLQAFKPNAALVDEAGQSSPADTMTPLAAHKESLKLIVLAGDHKQLKPVRTSRNRNEVFRMTETSLFEMLLNNKHRSRSQTMFNVQYRMAPQLSKFVIQHIYPGLTDGDSTKADNKYRQAFRTLMKIMPDYNGRLRVALHSGSPSNYFEGTMSYCNDREAVKCLEHALGLIRNGVPVEEIKIVTPYDGQKRMFKKIVYSMKDDVLRKLDIWSTSDVQGRQASAVIVSLVRNEPESSTDIGFIYKPEQLVVELSRAKDSLTIFGNFVGWLCELKKKDTNSRFARSSHKLFRDLLQDLENHKDYLNGDDYNDAIAKEIPPPQESTFWPMISTAAPKKAAPTGLSGSGSSGFNAPQGNIRSHGAKRQKLEPNNPGATEASLLDFSKPHHQRNHNRGNRGGRGGRGGPRGGGATA